ncbi:MAG: YIP1 family protein [Vulcanimicrobiaceae bacterium]
MGVDAPMPRKANGLFSVANVFAAPRETFETLRIAPMWRWAFLIGVILFFAGTMLALPAGRHASIATIQRMEHTSPFFANMSEAQKQQALVNAGKTTSITYIFAIVRGALTFLVMALCNAAILLVFNAAGKGQGDFKRFWCGSMYVAVPTIGIGSIVLGIICFVRGPDSFNTTADIFRAMPSLATIAPNVTGAATSFLATINPFTIWGLFLNATLLMTVARTSKRLSYTAGIVIMLLTAVMQAAVSSAAHGFGLG